MSVGVFDPETVVLLPNRGRASRRPRFFWAGLRRWLIVEFARKVVGSGLRKGVSATATPAAATPPNTKCRRAESCQLILASLKKAG
jgi:hypothetical protein